MTEAVTTRNLYYTDGIDLQKMRDDAERGLAGDLYSKPQACVIHHHKYEESCEPHDHDYFSLEREEDGTTSS